MGRTETVWVVHGAGDDVKEWDVRAATAEQAIAIVGRRMGLPTEHWWARPNEAVAMQCEECGLPIPVGQHSSNPHGDGFVCPDCLDRLEHS